MSKIKIVVICIVLFFVVTMSVFIWYLFLPSKDVTHSESESAEYIGKIMTFDVPMVYVKNCEHKCSFSPRVSSEENYLMPAMSLTSAINDFGDYEVNYILEDEQFTVLEVFTTYPRGIDNSFNSITTYLVVKDRQGIISIVNRDIYEQIDQEIDSRRKNSFNGSFDSFLQEMQFIRDIGELDTFWLEVFLKPINSSEPYGQEGWDSMIVNIQNNFLNTLPKEYVLEYKKGIDNHVYIQTDNKNTFLYLLSNRNALNLLSVSLHGENLDPGTSL